MSLFVDPAFLARLEALRLTVRKVRWGTRLGGRFPISRRGSSGEFADYAAYTPGDDIRAIDWNLYARLDRLFVRIYKEEIELSVEIFLDATASMGLPSREKFEVAKRLAVSLGYVGLAGRHQVRLHGIGQTERASPWCVHRRDVQRIVDFVEQLTPEGRVTLPEWMRRRAATLHMRGGQAIVISDGMVRPAEFFQAIHELLRRHLEVKVIQVITTEELHPARLFRGGVLVDTETGFTHQLAYSPRELEHAVEDHNERLVRFCKRQGIPFAQCRIEEPLEPFITKTLPALGFLE